MDALATVEGVDFYCPEWDRYRYVVAHRDGIVFGFAIGLKLIGLRLPGDASQEARADGGTAVDGLSDAWVGFTLFDPSRPEPDIETHARRAAERSG